MWMLATRPPNGEGISTVALSVSTSRSGASSAMTSPSLTRTLTISASVSPSPRSGSANGRGIASEREGRARGGDEPGHVGDVRLLAREADERHIVRGHASNRRLEREEGAVHDRGGDLGARAEAPRRLVDDDRAARFLDRPHERVAIERRDREQIDHLHADPILVAEDVGGLERHAEHRA